MADPLKDLHNVESQTIKAAQKSQNKIDNVFEQTIELKAEYDTTINQTEILKVYNDHLARFGCRPKCGY
jgi:DNA/RNA-binding domain of Phe-tRNA-synthetase-like protein